MADCERPRRANCVCLLAGDPPKLLSPPADSPARRHFLPTKRDPPALVGTRSRAEGFAPTADARRE